MKTTLQTCFFEGIESSTQFDASIGNMTSYKIGGLAEVLAKPTSIEALITIVSRCKSEHVPFHILGKGANVLVDDCGIDGVVIKLDNECFNTTKLVTEGSDQFLHCMGGADLSKTIMQTAKDGICCLEHLAGIPASIGGGLRMNAGGRFGSMIDTLD